MPRLKRKYAAMTNQSNDVSCMGLDFAAKRREMIAQGVSPGQGLIQSKALKGRQISAAPSGLLTSLYSFPGLTPCAILSRRFAANFDSVHLRLTSRPCPRG